MQKVKVRRQFVIELSIDDVPDEASLEYEPYTVLTNKITALSDLLGCSEREAQRMILEML
jgi:hypothetical protein